MKYCLPIITSSLSDLQLVLSKTKADYDLFEIWLDYLEGISIDVVKNLENELGHKAIFLFRRRALEPVRMALQQRQEIINALTGRAYLDLDFETQKEELNLWRSAKVKIPLILSYHNYKATPLRADLWSLVQEMEALSPAILKVATFCNSEEDALLLLSLVLRLREQGRRCLVLGMGEHGKVTRIFGTLWGNEFVFAPQNDASSSAPGQLTQDQLKNIFKFLGVEQHGRK